MDRSKNELEIKSKVNMIVRDKLPKFASRYFKANMETKSIQSLYGYALEGRPGEFQGITNIRDDAIVTLIASTGIKVSELVNMNIDDVHLDEHYISIYGRGNKKRIIYTSDICGLARDSILQYYRPYIDDYESRKVQEYPCLKP